MFKKFAPTFVAACVASCFALPAGAAVQDGTFQGVGNGRGGPVKVSVTFKSGKIVDVQVLSHTETAGVADPALKQTPASIVANNSVKIDAVSGATMTSNGILQAVGAAIVAAGGKTADFSSVPVKKAASDKTERYATDIVVIGAGAGGMSAAVRASSLGANVIVIEKRANIGGATQLNAGTLVATGSRYQRDVMKETKDSPELLAKDILRAGHNKNDPTLVKMVGERAGEVVDWLIDDLKIPYGPAATQYPDHSASRQLGVEGRSVNWLRLMSQKLDGFGGKIMTNTRAEELVLNDKGEVVGVKARLADGSMADFTAKRVILASGGYGANRDMLPPVVASYLFYGLDTETGDGLRMGKKVGADTINLDLVKQYPQGVETLPHRALAASASSTDTMKLSGAIYVNRAGKRITDELAGLGHLTEITEAQEGAIMYIVMDQAAWEKYVAKSLEDKLVASEADLQKWASIYNNGYPVLAKAETLAEAAKKMGIDPAGLQATVDHWNDMVKSGKDVDFGRSVLKPLKGAPYYIVEQKPRFQTTLGGLKADAQMRILNTNGQPIGNLWGAGCVVGGANGDDSLTAMMNSWAIISGYVAGDNAVKSLKKAK